MQLGEQYAVEYHADKLRIEISFADGDLPMGSTE
jgi:YD repeat-containing protein